MPGLASLKKDTTSSGQQGCEEGEAYVLTTTISGATKENMMPGTPKPSTWSLKPQIIPACTEFATQLGVKLKL